MYSPSENRPSRKVLSFLIGGIVFLVLTVILDSVASSTTWTCATISVDVKPGMIPINFKTPDIDVGCLEANTDEMSPPPQPFFILSSIITSLAIIVGGVAVFLVSTKTPFIYALAGMGLVATLVRMSGIISFIYQGMAIKKETIEAAEGSTLGIVDLDVDTQSSLQSGIICAIIAVFLHAVGTKLSMSALQALQ